MSTTTTPRSDPSALVAELRALGGPFLAGGPGALLSSALIRAADLIEELRTDLAAHITNRRDLTNRAEAAESRVKELEARIEKAKAVIAGGDLYEVCACALVAAALTDEKDKTE